MNCPGQRGNWRGTEGRARLGGTWDRPRCSIATVRQGRGRPFFVVAAHVPVLVVGAAIREPMSRLAAVVAGTGSQPRFDERDRASQVSISLSKGSSNLSMLPSDDLRPLNTVKAHCTATTAHRIRSGQARRKMLVEFLVRFFNRLARTTTNRPGSHDLSTRTFEVRRSSAATPQHVVLGS